MRKLLAALLLVLFAVAPAAAQLPNIQDMAVWGRVGSPAADGGSGPTQAIPFANLFALFSGVTLPVVSGHLVCFNGTAGQIKDCTTTLPAGLTLPTPNIGVATATSINGLTIFTGNNQANIGLGTPFSSQVGSTSNVIVGVANALTTGDQNVIVGTGGTGLALTADSGNTLIGYDVAPSLHNAVIPNNFNTAVGNQALRTCTTCGSNVAVGRASMLAAIGDDHNTAVGHATLFSGAGNSQTTAIGDSAGGTALAGTAILSGFPNVGTNVFPFNGDTNVECIGESCGKTSAAARKQSFAIGTYSRIPAQDNSFWLGNGMAVGGTAAKFWSGLTSVTVNSNTGVTLTCAQLLTGIINRTGSASAGFTDTTPTAQQIVQCASGGPGNGAEVPISIEIVYINNATTQTATIAAGSGVTLAGIGTSVSNNLTTRWRVIITNSTLSSEAVTFYRVS